MAKPGPLPTDVLATSSGWLERPSHRRNAAETAVDAALGHQDWRFSDNEWAEIDALAGPLFRANEREQNRLSVREYERAHARLIADSRKLHEGISAAAEAVSSLLDQREALSKVSSVVSLQADKNPQLYRQLLEIQGTLPAVKVLVNALLHDVELGGAPVTVQAEASGERSTLVERARFVNELAVRFGSRLLGGRRSLAPKTLTAPTPFQVFVHSLQIYDRAARQADQAFATRLHSDLQPANRQPN